MKIHDKFVIELSEVIKGFANDYQVKEPCNLPCDYKFYEIAGVAICEESFQKMTPLETEIKKVLNDIKAEMEKLIEWHDCPIELDNGNDTWCCEAVKRCIEIIENYER